MPLIFTLSMADPEKFEFDLTVEISNVSSFQSENIKFDFALIENTISSKPFGSKTVI